MDGFQGKVKIFADGADKNDMLALNANVWVKGFTTNPTLMKKAGVKDYAQFAEDILKTIHDKPISFEVFADDFNAMRKQAIKIAKMGAWVYVKIPITNTKGHSSEALIRDLSQEGVKLNVTAITTEKQVEKAARALELSPSAYVSVFAGRIADTGVDPLPVMQSCMTILSSTPQLELIWASPRELFNIIQAESIGCHVITATKDILNKMDLIGKDLEEYSLETVKMFYNDAVNAGYVL